MKTIQHPIYTFRRAGNITYCTISVDIKYILSLLARPTSLYIKYMDIEDKVYSIESKLFYKELKHLGFILDVPILRVTTSIKLNKDDKDNPELALKIVKKKAFRLMCYKVATAINRVLEHRKREIEKLENILIKLQINARRYEE